MSAASPAPVDPAGRTVARSIVTRRALALGTALAVACFAIALVLESLGRPTGGGGATDLRAVIASAAAFETWGWATLGTFAVIATPAVAIATTGLEYRAAGDGRTALGALGVLAILALSLAVSLSR